MEYIPASSLDVDAERFDSGSLTVLQAARQAGVTQSAIIRWIRNGYLPATPSNDGWQIPADKLHQAQVAADESRGTGPVPRQTGPRLVPAPAELRRSLAVKADEQPVRLDVLSETLVTPLVELIRDQTDVVHDQAEVIGWLQAERSRLNAQLAELAESQAAPEPQDTVVPEQESSVAEDSHEDEVVSWLWNDAGRPYDTFGTASTSREREAAPVSGSSDSLIFETRAAEHDMADLRDQPTEQFTTVADRARKSFDESWFVIPNSQISDPVSDVHDTATPRLRPIVVRSETENTHLGMHERDADLGQIIDETERKIAEMWRHEAQLSSMRGGGAGTSSSEDDQEPFWQRVWPLKRRSS